ncbi:hypothetical protein UFOVP81_31 [uncultured Caudovirales phage]|uniref:DNA transfer protein n=1 Tax=uncultured Caudovirales phage TaxID=2100421 RepID=A0A6J5L4E0_9CAUD|nr:hypothetical protein UFOVP81_31 [uncultured Caudovirales phage]
MISLNAATAIGTIVTGFLASRAQSNAASAASSAQQSAINHGMEVYQREFDALKDLFKPYMTAGTQALSGQQNLVGLNGSQAQQQAIDQLQNSPIFQSLVSDAEAGILQNASATGGVRGGNVQGALGQLRPSMLNDLINQQYNRLGGLSSIGANTANAQAGYGMNFAQATSDLLNNFGKSQAANALAQGRSQLTLIDSLGSAFGIVAPDWFGDTAKNNSSSKF